jgi:hypothetical protein
MKISSTLKLDIFCNENQTKKNNRVSYTKFTDCHRNFYLMVTKLKIILFIRAKQLQMMQPLH